MADRPEMPYEKAIEETAKTGGKALDIVQSMSPAIATAYGLVIGDRVNAARERQLDALARKTKKILRDRDAKEEEAVPEHIAIPLLEAAQGETREAIQDIYAAILANAMDPKFANDVRPEFIDTVKALQPNDAAILKIISDGVRASKMDPTQAGVSAGKFRYVELAPKIDLRLTSIQVSIDTLRKLGCIESAAGYITMLPYGIELMIACDKNATHRSK